MKTIALFNDSGWAQDTRFGHAQWQEEVGQEATLCGYAQWLVGKYDEEGVAVAIDPPQAPEALSHSSADEDDTPGLGQEDWREEVLNLDTRLSYWDWVAHQKEAALED